MNLAAVDRQAYVVKRRDAPIAFADAIHAPKGHNRAGLCHSTVLTNSIAKAAGAGGRWPSIAAPIPAYWSPLVFEMI